MSLLRNCDFRLLWVGQAISETGSRVSREGIPLTAAMMLSATPMQMGFLAGVSGIATLLAATGAGLLADRTKRRPLMIAADLGRAAALLTIPIAAWQGWLSISLLIPVAAVHGLLTVFFDVAYQTWIPTFVPKHQLLEANSKLMAAASTAEVIGPGLTGVLVQWLTAPIAILVDSFSFLVSAVAVASIHKKEETIAVSTEAFSWKQALAGFSVVATHPILRAFALRSASINLVGGIFVGLYVLYAIKILGLTPVQLGIAVAAGGVSNLTGALLAEKLAKFIPVGKLLIGVTVWSGFVLLLLPMAVLPFPGGFWCLFLGQLLGDAAFSIYAIHETTIRQQMAPPETLGRVNAAMQLVLKGGWPIGAMIGGFLAGYISVPQVLFISALGVMGSALFLLFSPVRNLR